MFKTVGLYFCDKMNLKTWLLDNKLDRTNHLLHKFNIKLESCCKDVTTLLTPIDYLLSNNRIYLLLIIKTRNNIVLTKTWSTLSYVVLTSQV